MPSMNIPIFIPHYGCPNGCVFCNQQKISGKDTLDDEAAIRKFIEASISTSEGKSDIEIAFFGGSFTGLEQDVQRNYLELATEYVEKYHLKGIRLSTRPDYIHESVMELLLEYPVTSIELGVQSLDPDVLKLTKRNHTVLDVERAIEYINKSHISLGLQMMIGLPGDTLFSALDTARKMIAYNPDTIRIYPTLVLQATELAKMLEAGEYQPLSLDEAVNWMSNILPLFIEASITVLRVGLQANEGLNSDVVLAGPYHPAFKELVLDELVFNQICKQVDILINSLNLSYLEHIIGNIYPLDIKIESHVEKVSISFMHGGIELITSEKMGQRIMGHKRRNYQRLMDYFNTVFHAQLRLVIKKNRSKIETLHD